MLISGIKIAVLAGTVVGLCSGTATTQNAGMPSNSPATPNQQATPLAQPGN
jgi:hypothetical protein